MTDIQSVVGERTVRDRVREALRRAPAMQLELDLPERIRSLLDDLDYAMASRGRTS